MGAIDTEKIGGGVVDGVGSGAGEAHAGKTR
jgi:hypothetical protein